jgi:hypothetical protein
LSQKVILLEDFIAIAEIGIDINEKNECGETLLKVARKSQRQDIVEYILSNEKFQQEKDDSGMDLIIWKEATRKRVEVIPVKKRGRPPKRQAC